MRVLIAARLSKLAPGQTGLGSQEKETVRWSEDQGHEIIAVVGDRKSGRSGLAARPELRPWVTDPDKIAQYDAIVAYKVDRLTRGNRRETRELELWADEHGKMLIISSQGVRYPSEGSDGARWDQYLRGAHQEWLDISERYTRMHKDLQENGYTAGKIPFGYMAEKDGDHSKVVPDPELVPYVRGMFEHYRDGESLTQICEWLESEGVKPPAGPVWIQKSASQILRNKAYIGRKKNAGRILRIEPIVDATLFATVNRMLDAAPRRRGPVSSETALLTQIIRCYKCGAPMYRKALPRKEGKVLVYRCDGKPREPSTCKNMIPLSEADEIANSWFTDVIGDKEIVLTRTVPGNDHLAEIELTEAEIKSLDMDDPDFLARQAALLAERKRLKELPAGPALVQEVRTGQLMRDFWPSLTTADKRKWMKSGGVSVKADRDHFEVTAIFGQDWSVEMPVPGLDKGSKDLGLEVIPELYLRVT